MAYPEYDPNEPSLGQTFADLLRGVKNPKSWQEVGQGIQNVAKVTPSVVESLGRGALVQLPALAGDTSQLARQFIPETMQNTFGNRTAPTSEEMLAKLPRMTPDYQGSQSHEMMGGVLSPAMPFLLRAGAEATKGLPIGNMIAYHGTPHEIKGAFDISKVGTGEGAQAYGHGMYFAENPIVAKQYRDNLSDFDWAFGGKPYDINNPAHRAAIELKQLGGDSAITDTIKRYEKNIADLETRDADWAKSAAQMKKEELAVLKTGVLPQLEETSKGNLYKVDIPDKDIPNMLDWDKPITSYSKQLQKQLNEIAIEEGLPVNYQKSILSQDRSGQDFYNAMTTKLGSADKASAILNSYGIKGIRYLDEGSRNLTNGEIINTFKTPEGWKTKVRVTGTNGTDANGKPISSFTTSMPFKTAKEAEDWAKTKISSGTSNFVVFNPKEVKILEKNSKPVTRKEILEQQIKKIE